MNTKSSLLGVGSALALLFATGCGGASSAAPAQPPAAAPAPAPAQVVCSPGQPASSTAPPQPQALVPTPVPTRTVAAPRPVPAAPPADSAFWQLIGETRSAAGSDTGRQSELLKERLTHLSPAAIIAFARTRSRLDRRAYTWNLWGAATVIQDGCSDDCFRDFRAYVISLGRAPYERALINPDSLASVAADAETGDWENADNVAPDAYSSVTGNDFPLDDTDLSGPPSGRSLNLDARALMGRFPRLAARFRH